MLGDGYVVQDKVIREIRVLRYETRHDVDDSSTSANAESTGWWERTQENKRGEKRDTLID